METIVRRLICVAKMYAQADHWLDTQPAAIADLASLASSASCRRECGICREPFVFVEEIYVLPAVYIGRTLALWWLTPCISCRGHAVGGGQRRERASSEMVLVIRDEWLYQRAFASVQIRLHGR